MVAQSSIEHRLSALERKANGYRKAVVFLLIAFIGRAAIGTTADASDAVVEPESIMTEEVIQLTKTEYLKLMISENLRERTGLLHDRISWTTKIQSEKNAIELGMPAGRPGITILFDHPSGTDMSRYSGHGTYQHIVEMIERQVRFFLETRGWQDDYNVKAVYEGYNFLMERYK